LVRLEKRFDEALGNEVRTTAKGQTLCEIAQTMLGAINPDNVEAKAKEGKDQYFQPTEKDLQVAQANGPPEILAVIAELCQKHDVIAITDEVYEHILYDDAIHTRLATLPGMAERTLTISSLGKTFSVTGWKIGWALGPASLVNAVNQAHQFITYAVASPLQAAAAKALNLPISFFENLQRSYQARRDRMLDVFAAIGCKAFKPQGSFFIMIDWCGIAPAQLENDFQFATWLIRDVGVACIPASPFYQEADKHLGKHFARFAVCKRDETLTAAAERLIRLAKR
jgi:aspartate/methionine/tyrosine aminotransferase